MTRQQRCVLKVLDNMKAMVAEDDSYAEMFAPMLESGLNSLQCEDAFGTEAQCDPRGDFRNGQWNMDQVEGVDAA